MALVIIMVALVNGLFVIFESKNTENGKYHGRFKQRYRTKSDALAAKAVWEKRGKILWPDDLKKTPSPKVKPVTEQYRAAAVQQGMQL